MSDDYCKGFDCGHKLGFEAGFKAAMSTFEKMSFVLNHEISFFPDEKIEERYQDWFGKSKQTHLQAFDRAEEAEA